jgi:predicted nucleic acid-binding protein
VATFFCDSSAIVKRYINETDSNFVEDLADVKNDNVILPARITQVEIAAAIARRLKGGSIATADAQKALVAFQHDLTNSYFTVEITPLLSSRAMSSATNMLCVDMMQFSWQRLWNRTTRELPTNFRRSLWFLPMMS